MNFEKEKFKWNKLSSGTKKYQRNSRDVRGSVLTVSNNEVNKS